MTTLVNTLSRISTSPNLETEALKVFAMCCGAILFVFVLSATYGLDLSPGFF